LETRLNLSDSRNANKQITELIEQAKKAKTKGEENRVLEKNQCSWRSFRK
jgi:hypothetical protein